MEFGCFLEICAEERGVRGVTPLQDSANGGICFWRTFSIVHSSLPTRTPDTMELEVNFLMQPCLESTGRSDGEQLPEGSAMDEEVILTRGNEGVLLHIVALYQYSCNCSI